MTAAQSTARESGMALGRGTVPDYVRTVLADHGVLGCMVEWFARVDDSPNADDPYADPATYRKYALASVTTHDLPPTAGYQTVRRRTCQRTPAPSCREAIHPAHSDSARIGDPAHHFQSYRPYDATLLPSSAITPDVAAVARRG